MQMQLIPFYQYYSDSKERLVQKRKLNLGLFLSVHSLFSVSYHCYHIAYSVSAAQLVLVSPQFTAARGSHAEIRVRNILPLPSCSLLVLLTCSCIRNISFDCLIVRKKMETWFGLSSKPFRIGSRRAIQVKITASLAQHFFLSTSRSFLNM